MVSGQNHQAFQASFSIVNRFLPVFRPGTYIQRTDPRLTINPQNQLNGPGFDVSVGYLFSTFNLLVSAHGTVRPEDVAYLSVYQQPVPGSGSFLMPIRSNLVDVGINVTKYFDANPIDPLINVGVLWMNRNSGVFIPLIHNMPNPPGPSPEIIREYYGFFAILAGIGGRYDHWQAVANLIWGFQNVYNFTGNVILPEVSFCYYFTR